MNGELKNLAKLIDHTILAPDATRAQVQRFCVEAIENSFCSVCVNPVYTRLVATQLSGTGVRTCTVIGFPLGAAITEIKAAEAAYATGAGADEIDMVIAIGALKDGDHDCVRRDIAGVRRNASRALLKVIIETCLLTDDEKILACQFAKAEGADFVKTSTGFSRSGATIADIALMRAAAGPDMGVKASGGIRTREAAEAMIAAGASRLGTSSGVAIIGGAPAPA